MRSHPSLFATCCLGLLAPAFAQRPASNPSRPAQQQQRSPQPDEDEEVVRITKPRAGGCRRHGQDGRHVKDLSPPSSRSRRTGGGRRSRTSLRQRRAGGAAAARPSRPPAARRSGTALPSSAR